MSLKLVPKVDPSPTEAVRQRVKTMQRRDGALQCNRCGCRTSLTLVNGAIVKKGRKQGGTVIEKDICAECWKRGDVVSMLPDMKRIV